MKDGIEDIWHLLGKPIKLPNGPSFGDSLAAHLGRDLGPSILRAFEGGADPGRAIGGSIANSITASIGKEGLGKAIETSVGGSLGRMLGSFAPGVGTLLGGLAGSMVGKLFGDSKEKQENKAATGEVKKLGSALVETYGSMENLRQLGKLAGIDIAGAFGHQGKAGLEQFKKDIGGFEKALAATKTKINGELEGLLGGFTGMGFKIPAALAPTLDHLREIGVLTEGTQSLLAQFGDNAVIDYKRMEEAAARYNIPVEKLGKGFNTAQITASVSQILEDYDLLSRGGAEPSVVIEGMAGKISEVAVRSRALGISMPENMRPIIESLVAKGHLLDANGNKIEDMNGMSFGDPIKVGLERIADLLEKLVKGFGIELPRAIGMVPREVPIDVTTRYRSEGERPRAVDIGEPGPGSYAPIGVPGAAAGGLFSRPTFRVIAEKEPEFVGSQNMLAASIAEGFRRVQVAGGPMPSTMQVNLVPTEGGRPLASALVEPFAGAVRSRIGRGRRR